MLGRSAPRSTPPTSGTACAPSSAAAAPSTPAAPASCRMSAHVENGSAQCASRSSHSWFDCLIHIRAESTPGSRCARWPLRNSPSCDGHSSFAVADVAPARARTPPAARRAQQSASRISSFAASGASTRAPAAAAGGRCRSSAAGTASSPAAPARRAPSGCAAAALFGLRGSVAADAVARAACGSSALRCRPASARRTPSSSASRRRRATSSRRSMPKPCRIAGMCAIWPNGSGMYPTFITGPNMLRHAMAAQEVAHVRLAARQRFVRDDVPGPDQQLALLHDALRCRRSGPAGSPGSPRAGSCARRA